MTLGQRLRQLRQARGWKQSEVALACDLSVSRLSALERDDGLPMLVTLIALANMHGLTVQQVLTGVDGMGSPASPQSRPLALQRLVSAPHPDLPQPCPEWMALLARIEHRGQRPRDPAAYLALFLHLRRVLGV